jgi:cation diffusion facilitator CzcD-associated flavoprotein CzcO
MSSATGEQTREATATGSVDVEALAVEWLSAFEAAAGRDDIDGILELFVDDCWWRDWLAVTWDLRTMRGAEGIRALAGGRLARAGFHDLAVDDRIPPGEAGGIASVAYTFKTKVAAGRGILRLRRDGEQGPWKAWVLLTKVEELLDFPEQRTRLSDAAAEQYTVARTGRESWGEMRERRREFTEADPDVVVVGGGHAGLTAAARLEHLGLATVILERNARLGDVWRQRYFNLSLHDSKFFGNMPYLPFPDNWPVFAPKDLIGDWFEAYATVLQLNAWTSSEVLGASYDEASERWAVEVRREGQIRVLHPRHVVFATGAHGGDPGPPELPGLESFRGVAVHSASHRGGDEMEGKRVIVVGTGSSGHDVAQDAYEMGAEVTMVQRGATYVMSVKSGVPTLHQDSYSETTRDFEDSDLEMSAAPWELFIEEAAGPLIRKIAELDAELLAGLNEAGFRTTLGYNDSGLLGQNLLHPPRGGGYYIDKGCSQLIIDGKIKVKGGVVTGFTETGVTYDDGSEQEADVVVFAIGFPNMRDNVRPIVGDELADTLSPVWRLDDGGEIAGAWRPTGHPRLWFNAGGFWQTRIGSKLLALQIKAAEEGLVED